MNHFNFSGVRLNWFPGHMATGLKQIRSRLQNEIDLIIEVRDARIPFSSSNTEMILGDEETTSKRIVIFTKKDLAGEEENKKIEKNMEGMLYCKDDRRDLKKLLEMTKNHFKDSNPFTKNRVIVVGIPNVGKSTIINGLRSAGLGLNGKAVKVGNLAGVTRSISELVCISRQPLIYLIDTPGILPPNIKNVEEGLKVALCGGLYDKTVGFNLLAEYLLYNLNLKSNNQFKEFYRLDPDSPDAKDLKRFLPVAAKRIGALVSGGEFDLERTATYFVRQFRMGKFGRMTLDHVDDMVSKQSFN